MPRLIFIHIPKTAGTSFHNALCQGFGPAAVSPGFPAYRMTEAQAAELARYEVIAGHISLTDVQRFFPGVPMITILRAPIDRCRSWYDYARRVPPSEHTDVKAAQTHDIDDFFSLDPSITYRNIFNRQVRQLGGHALTPDPDYAAVFAQAEQTLAQCAWVGRQEHLPEDLIRLAQVFPEMAGVALAALNVTPRRQEDVEISASLRHKIAAYNQWDIALYRQIETVIGIKEVEPQGQALLPTSHPDVCS